MLAAKSWCHSVCLFSSFLPAENNEPYMKIPCSDSKITSAVWGPLGEFIIAGHESGELNQFSAKVSVIRRSITLRQQRLGEDIAAFLL